MSRNRYRRKQVRSGAVPGILTLVLFTAAALALSYLWVRNQCDLLGKQIKDLELSRITLERRVAVEQSNWSNMKSPEGLERLLQSHRLAMAFPPERDVVRLHAQTWAQEAGDPFRVPQYAEGRQEIMHD
jgi:hypothetical protein